MIAEYHRVQRKYELSKLRWFCNQLYVITTNYYHDLYRYQYTKKKKKKNELRVQSDSNILI